MAKKRTPRGAKSRRSTANPSAKRRQKLILGGVILILVLAAGGAIRSWQQRNYRFACRASWTITTTAKGCPAPSS